MRGTNGFNGKNGTKGPPGYDGQPGGPGEPVSMYAVAVTDVFTVHETKSVPGCNLHSIALPA